MTMPPLPELGDTSWRDDWAQAVHNAAAEVVSGRLAATAQSAAFGAPIEVLQGVTEPLPINALRYGVKADAVELLDVRCTAGSTSVYCPGATFTSADIGKVVAVVGAGASGGLVTTGASGGNFITAVADAEHVTMTVAAATTTSGPRSVTDGVMTQDSQTLASATATFSASDVGRTVTVAGAGERDRRVVTERASITSGSTTLSASYACFTTAMIGQRVTISGAGAAGAPLQATITAVAGGGLSCTLSAAAGTTVAGWALVQAWTVADLVTVITKYNSATNVGLRRRATTPVSAALTSISGAAGVYGTNDTAAWQALVDLVPAGSVLTLPGRRSSMLGTGTLDITKPLTFRAPDQATFHYAVTSGRVRASAHGVTWERWRFRALQTSGVASAFATKTSGALGCRNWRFIDPIFDGVRANFERIGAMQTSGALATTGSDFAGLVLLERPEITGACGEGGLYVFGADDVRSVESWVHDNGMDSTSGDAVKVSAGAKGFFFTGISEWNARDGIDLYDAVGATIDATVRHNQENGLEAKWSTTQHYNATGRHVIKLRTWNNQAGCNVGAPFTTVDVVSQGDRTNGVRAGAASDTNATADATPGMIFSRVIALGAGGTGVILTKVRNFSAAMLHAFGCGQGITVEGQFGSVEGYQAFGNVGNGMRVVTGSDKILLRGHSQDAGGYAVVDAGATNISLPA